MPLAARDYDELRGLFAEPPLPLISGANAISQTLARNQGLVNTVALAATGVMMCVALHMPGGVTVTNISLVSGGTVEGTGTASFMALYTWDLKLIGQTTNDTGAAAIGANTVYTRAFTSPLVTPYSGMFYAAISVTATTIPTACGITQVTNAGLQAVTPILSGTTGSGVGGTAPAAPAALTSSVSIPFLILS